MTVSAADKDGVATASPAAPRTNGDGDRVEDVADSVDDDSSDGDYEEETTIFWTGESVEVVKEKEQKLTAVRGDEVKVVMVHMLLQQGCISLAEPANPVVSAAADQALLRVQSQDKKSTTTASKANGFFTTKVDGTLRSLHDGSILDILEAKRLPGDWASR